MRDYLGHTLISVTGTPGHGVPYKGEVKYGPRAEHCWNGDPNLPNAYSRLHYNMYLPQIMERIEEPTWSRHELEVLGSVCWPKCAWSKIRRLRRLMVRPRAFRAIAL